MAVLVETAATNVAGVLPDAGTTYPGCVIFPNDPLKSIEVRSRGLSQLTAGTTRTMPIAPDKVYWFWVAVTSVAPPVTGPFHPAKKLGW